MADSTNRHIEFENVEVRFSEFVSGLRGISLSVQRGEFAFLVGSTGAGKSTMLKLLMRELKPTSGRLLLDGEDVGAIRDRDVPALRRKIGYVPQDFALLPRKRVWENVAYAMRAVGATRREVRRRVPEILEQVSILYRADAFPNELSGGEQQRVAIARALINNPSLLLADEPTGNLDPEHSWEIMELLQQVNLRGTTVLVATHDLMVVSRLAKRVVSLDSGRVASDVRPEASDALAEIREKIARSLGPESGDVPEVSRRSWLVQPPESGTFAPLDERVLGIDLEEADAELAEFGGRNGRTQATLPESAGHAGFDPDADRFTVAGGSPAGREDSDAAKTATGGEVDA